MKLARFRAGGGMQDRESVAAWGLSLLVGAASVWLGWAPDAADVQALETEIGQLQARLQPTQTDRPTPKTGPAELSPAWPLRSEQTAASTWLQQGAQAHGLKVEAMHALPAGPSTPLPEQPWRWRMQGRWGDWLSWEAALDAHAPWWVVDQWLVLPDEGSAGDVRMELQGRIGLQAELPDAQPPEPADWPVWRHERLALAAGAAVFAPLPPVRDAEGPQADPPAASASPEALPSDPRLWPVSHLQLLGVWWQEGVAHAVLGRGLMQVTVTQGQRIGREAYLVRRITPAGVQLQDPQGRGLRHLLELKTGGAP